MATASWFHCSVKTISRSAGRTAIAAAAYRAGARLQDRQTQQIHDYTRRGGVISSFIVAPEKAPSWAYDLEALWNAAQEADNRRNSTLAREAELALPGSLPAEAREEITRNFARHLVERYGVVVAVALHEPGRHGDERNYHAHIMFTTRRMEEDGLGKKTRELDAHATGAEEIKHIREYAAQMINEALERVGLDERVDHRSFADRGINHVAEAHLGPDATAMERRGERSDLGDHNREVQERNQTIDALVGELAALDAEISEEMAKEFLPVDAEPVSDAEPAPKLEPAAQATALTWEEIKRAAQNPMASQITQQFEADIKESGTIRESGLDNSWYDRAVSFWGNLYYGAVNFVKDLWESYTGARDRDISRPGPQEHDHERW
jgi:hypothetical protein